MKMILYHRKIQTWLRLRRLRNVRMTTENGRETISLEAEKQRPHNLYILRIPKNAPCNLDIPWQITFGM